MLIIFVEDHSKKQKVLKTLKTIKKKNSEKVRLLGSFPHKIFKEHNQRFFYLLKKIFFCYNLYNYEKVGCSQQLLTFSFFVNY